MHIPGQGFRHSVVLLITRRLRELPHDATPNRVDDEIARLARDLAGLAADMLAGADVVPWVSAEFDASVERLQPGIDRRRARAALRAVLEDAIGATPEETPADLFLVFAPPDRLPLAAPLAIALVKRLVSVALARYEIDHQEQLESAVARGLQRHRAGVLLYTPAFVRTGCTIPQTGSRRFRVVDSPEEPGLPEALKAWLRTLPSLSAISTFLPAFLG